MDLNIMKGSYYLMDCETYEGSKRIIVKKELTNREKELYYPKVKIAYGHGIFFLLQDNEEADPMLLCTQGYISFV